MRYEETKHKLINSFKRANDLDAKINGVDYNVSKVKSNYKLSKNLFFESDWITLIWSSLPSEVI